jgi:hypothetical protein
MIIQILFNFINNLEIVKVTKFVSDPDKELSIWSDKTCNFALEAQLLCQAGLELRDIDVESPVETQGRRQRRNNLRDQAVQVGVGRTLNIQVAAADVVQSLVVDLVGDVGVLQQGVHAQHGVVGLDDSGGDLRAAPDREGDLGLLAVVNGQALQHQAAQTGTRTTTDSMIDHESLQPGAEIGRNGIVRISSDKFLMKTTTKTILV